VLIGLGLTLAVCSRTEGEATEQIKSLQMKRGVLQSRAIELREDKRRVSSNEGVYSLISYLILTMT
jgi:hypothetical protein